MRNRGGGIFEHRPGPVQDSGARLRVLRGAVEFPAIEVIRMQQRPGPFEFREKARQPRRPVVIEPHFRRLFTHVVGGVAQEPLRQIEQSVPRASRPEFPERPRRNGGRGCSAFRSRRADRQPPRCRLGKRAPPRREIAGEAILHGRNASSTACIFSGGAGGPVRAPSPRGLWRVGEPFAPQSGRRRKAGREAEWMRLCLHSPRRRGENSSAIATGRAPRPA